MLNDGFRRRKVKMVVDIPDGWLQHGRAVPVDKLLSN